MPETRFTEFRHYPLTRGLGFLGLHRRPMFDYCLIIFLSYDIKNCYLLSVISVIVFFTFFVAYQPFTNVIRCFRSGENVTSFLKIVLTSFLTSLVSCLSPFSSTAKIEQTLSHR